MLIRCLCLGFVFSLLPAACVASEHFVIFGASGFFPAAESAEQQSLAEAISSGDLSAVKSAAEKVDLKDVSRYGLRDYVLVNGTAEIVQSINSLAKLKITPLQIAVIANDRKAVKRLFPRLALRPPCAYSSSNLSPLRLAIRKQNVPMVKLLIEQNMPVHEHIETFKPRKKVNILLSAAIHEGNAEIVRLLVDAGSQLEEPESYLVPVEGATHNGEPVKELLNDFSSPFAFNSRFPSYWRSPSYKEDYAEYKRVRAERKKLVQELNEKGLMRREKLHNANHGCPLADAVSAGRAKVVKVLLEAGADPNISIGGHPNLASGGHTYPLHMACGSGHPGIVKLLIDAGANVNQADSKGRTPLGLGYYKGDIADMLRAAGAEMKMKKAKDNGVKRPIDHGVEPVEPTRDNDANGNE